MHYDCQMDLRKLTSLMPCPVYIGCLTYREIFLPDAPTNFVQKASLDLKDDTPVYMKISKGDSKGIKVSPTFTHKDALDQPAWYFAKKLINKEYFEV